MSEHAKSYIQLCLRTNNCEPNNVEVDAYFNIQGRSDVVSWIMPGEHTMIDHLAWKGLKLLESVDTIKYDWVEVKVVGTPSILNTEMKIEVVGISVGDP